MPGSTPAKPADLDRLAWLSAEPSLQQLLAQAADPDRRFAVHGLVGSAPALVLTLLHHTLRRPMLVVVDTQPAVYDLEEDLRFFREWLGWSDDAGDGRILPFPHIESLPYEDREPQQAIRCQRTLVRQYLAGAWPNAPAYPVILAPVRSLIRRLPPAQPVLASTLVVERGGSLDRDEFARRLVEDGYEFREMVTAPGHFAVRGGIVDLFPVSANEPFRIELWGDEVDSIRVFDVTTQRSVRQVETCAVFPSLENSTAMFWAAEGGTLDRLVDVLPPNTVTVVVHFDAVDHEARKVEELVLKRYRERCQRTRTREEPSGQTWFPAVPPDQVWERAIGVIHWLARDAHVVIETPEHPAQTSDGPRQAVLVQCQSAEVIGEEVADRLATPLIQAARGERVTVVCDNKGQVDRLRELLRDMESHNEQWLARRAADAVQALVGTLHNGFGLPEIGLRLFTDRELFHRYRRFRTTSFSAGEPVFDVVELKPDDHVVHVDHGIAVYKGLRMLDLDGRRREFLELRFADDDLLYVPLEQMERVGRYVGTSDEAPELSRLGTKAWSRAKAKAREAIEEMADELLELYALRQTLHGHAFSPDTTWQQEFEAAFVYTETPDQWRSIGETKQDMEAERPMDRLICGDVGFGKTEVAIRAAFKAVMDGMQVAVLVPTTVLAEQHYRTISERLADYPVRVDLLSRFRTPGEVRNVEQALADGEIDIIVGTHKLLGKNVRFKNLGLLVIDEEQRFGVKHKERLKQLRTQVDVLTMSATPIPRTLYLSLSGIRDMSVINTPPRDRLPIETYVLNWSAETVESAILRELSRGGQVFFVHHEVRSIEGIAHILQEIVPDARICVGHGQMANRELERVMRRFVEGEFDILVSTTIIENGIDIPNVNTIIINHADHFGLAQLYQLRGRVGRSHHQAYCYLLVRDQRTLTTKARQRLVAIQTYNQLGAGFQVALRDMELRGIGNILGRAQSGHIAAIGFELYNQMLRDTVKRLREKTRPGLSEEIAYDDAASIQVSLGAAALIPPDYVPSGKQRMALHKRFASLASEAEVAAMREEVEDIYGQVPESVQWLFEEMRVRVLARLAGVSRVQHTGDQVFLQFSNYRVQHFQPTLIVELDRQFPGQIRVRQQHKTLGIEIPAPADFYARVELVVRVLRALRLAPPQADETQ